MINIERHISLDNDFKSHANEWLNESLLKTEELFASNKAKWFDSFSRHFVDMCVRIRKYQDKSKLSIISYLEYTMLYTNFINRHYLADIFAYGVNSYLDNNQLFIGSFNISFVFVYFDRLWDDLLNLRKRYVGKVSTREITKFMLQALPSFFSYLTSIARFSIIEFIEKSPFTDIDKNEEFRINVGEYMVKTENIYTINKSKDVRKLTKWFSERLWNTYFFGDYSCMGFSGSTFLYSDFRYARFQSSTLNNIDFYCSSLIGVNFRNASLERCQLNYCYIHEADFSHANLKNASFVNARAKAGLPNPAEWKFPGFLPVSFRYADLTNADFTGADLTGADFTGAILTGTIFTDAILDDAIFDSARSELNKL